MSRQSRFPGAWAAVLLLAAALGGCMSFGAAEPEAPEPYRQPLNVRWEGDAFIAGNHSAADGLVENLEARLPREARILCATFVRQDDLERTSAFGRLASAQFASRLVQAGYSVVEFRLRAEMGVRTGQGEFLLTRRTARFLRERYDAHAVLVGSYVADREAVFVSGQVVRLDSGVAVAAYDYAVPNRGLVARLVREDGESAGAGFEEFLRPRAVAQLATPAEVKAAKGQPAPGAGEPLAPIRLFPPTGKQ
jgi:hypothetical protein